MGPPRSSERLSWSAPGALSFYVFVEAPKPFQPQLAPSSHLKPLKAASAPANISIPRRCDADKIPQPRHGPKIFRPDANACRRTCALSRKRLAAYSHMARTRTPMRVSSHPDVCRYAHAHEHTCTFIDVWMGAQRRTNRG